MNVGIKIEVGEVKRKHDCNKCGKVLPTGIKRVEIITPYHGTRRLCFECGSNYVAEIMGQYASTVAQAFEDMKKINLVAEKETLKENIGAISELFINSYAAFFQEKPKEVRKKLAIAFKNPYFLVYDE
jgi:hypothetical protein